MSDLPSFLVVHITKTAGLASGVAAEDRVRIADTEYSRFAVVHHTGATPKSGHYTATVAASTTTYHCDDSTIAPVRNLHDAWTDCCMIFLQKCIVADVAPSNGAHYAAPPADATRSESNEQAPEAREDEACVADGGGGADDSEPEDPSEDDGLSDGEAPCADKGEDDDDMASKAKGCSDDNEGSADGADDECAGDSGGEQQCTVDFAQCRVTSTRHDDWLHRGPFLADLQFLPCSDRGSLGSININCFVDACF